MCNTHTHTRTHTHPHTHTHTRKLNASYVEEELGVHYMSNWRDPWGNRTMTLGEVGCFLSHYIIWNKVRERERERGRGRGREGGGRGRGREREGGREGGRERD